MDSRSRGVLEDRPRNPRGAGETAAIATRPSSRIDRKLEYPTPPREKFSAGTCTRRRSAGGCRRSPATLSSRSTVNRGCPRTMMVSGRLHRSRGPRPGHGVTLTSEVMSVPSGEDCLLPLTTHSRRPRGGGLVAPASEPAPGRRPKRRACVRRPGGSHVSLLVRAEVVDGIAPSPRRASASWR